MARLCGILTPGLTGQTKSDPSGECGLSAATLSGLPGGAFIRRSAVASKRMIHRDFFTSKDLEDLPATGRLLFNGMIVYADDAGIIRHHPYFFKHTLLHRLKVGLKEIDTYLDHLRTKSCISSVTLQGVSCWQITNFDQFQALKRRDGKRRDDEEKGTEASAHARENAAEQSSKDTKPEEPGAPTEPSVMERLCDEFHFGALKAKDLFDRWGYSHADLNAWLQFEAGKKSTKLRNHLMKSAKNPKDVEGFEPTPKSDRISSFAKPGKFSDARFH